MAIDERSRKEGEILENNGKETDHIDILLDRIPSKIV